MSDTTITVPAAYEAFARDLLNLSRKHGIGKFELDIEPEWRNADMQGVSVKFHGALIDGRGRPDTRLSMEVSAHRYLDVPFEPIPPLEAGDASHG